MDIREPWTFGAATVLPRAWPAVATNIPSRTTLDVQPVVIDLHCQTMKDFEMIDDLATRVRNVVALHLGVEPEQVVEHSSFIDDLDADSLDIVELVMAFEEEFGIEIPDHDAERILTVEDAISHIRSVKAGDGSFPAAGR